MSDILRQHNHQPGHLHCHIQHCCCSSWSLRRKCRRWASCSLSMKMGCHNHTVADLVSIIMIIIVLVTYMICQKKYLLPLQKLSIRSSSEESCMKIVVSVFDICVFGRKESHYKRLLGILWKNPNLHWILLG